MHEPRRSEIAGLINREGQITFEDLKKAFPDYSEMTLRTDLKALDEQGRIIRMHGGARSINMIARVDDDFYKKMTRNIEKKVEIAQKAVKLISPGDSLFIDCGSTMMQLVNLLTDEPHFIVTNNIRCAYDLARLEKVTVEVLGGTLNRINMSTPLRQNMENLSQYHFDVAFLAATAYDREFGFTALSTTMDETHNLVMSRSRRSVVLIDSSKIGQVLPKVSLDINKVSTVISDRLLPEDIAESLRSRGIEVL